MPQAPSQEEASQLALSQRREEKDQDQLHVDALLSKDIQMG